MSRLADGQGGAALVVALLVVAIATLLAYAIVGSSSVEIRRSEGIARAAAARELARGMEDWALSLLRQDLLDGGGYDTRQDPWAQPLPPLPVAGGSVTGQLIDLDGRFNLNSLLRPDGLRDGLNHQRLQRLLGLLQLSPAIADAVADWIDADSTVQGAGAESLDYLRADPPYRAANRPMVHLAELRLVQGVDDEIYQRLREYVTVLPSGTPLNLNTAAPLLWRALDPAISEELARRLSAEGRASYRGIGDIRTEFERAGLQLPPSVLQGVGVSSQYFLARAHVRADGHAETFYSVLQRTPEGGRVLQRSRGLYD